MTPIAILFWPAAGILLRRLVPAMLLDAGRERWARAAAARLDKTADVYAKTVSEIRGKAEAVNGSKLDRTIDDATKVLDDSKGRVEDDKVRAALENAIKSKDGKAISDAVKAVNDSIKAKSDADAKARAEKEGQAAGNTAQAPDNGSSYTGDTTGGYTGYTQSQGGYTYTPQQSTGGGYTPAPQPQPQPQPAPQPQPPQGGGNGGDGGWVEDKFCGVLGSDPHPC